MMNSAAPIHFSVPTRIQYGIGVLDRLAEECRALQINKALLVTDEGVRRSGVIELAEAPLREGGVAYATFAAVPVEPDLGAVDAGLRSALEQRCDGVIAVGGGSPLVAARAIAVLMTNPPPLRRYEGLERLQADSAPVIAVPTTAGSGAEVSPSIPITDAELGRRIVVRGRGIYPKAALLDPRTLASLPPAQFVASGIDAFSHAVEAAASRKAHPITDALAIDAAGRMMSVLPVAAYSDQLAAKGEQLLASSMAMLASGTVGLGLAHGVGNAIYALARSGSADRPLLPHGVLSGILLPHVMDFNLPAAAAKYAALARRWGVSAAGDEEEGARAAVERVRRLTATLGLPAVVPWEHLTADELDGMAESTMKTVQARENPRVAVKGDILGLVRRCFGLEAG